MHRSHSTLQSIFLMFVLLAIIQAARVSYAQPTVSEYGIVASLVTSKGQYALGELVEFSAFITNTNAYPVSVWAGSQATVVSTFSIANANGAVAYEWKPTGASSPLIHNVTINPSQTLQLGAVGLGKNLTWDQRSGTPDTPGGFVRPGRYIVTADISVVGFNPSATPCQPSGEDCDPNVNHSFNLQPSQDFSIGSSTSTSTPTTTSSSPDLSSYGYLLVVLAAALATGIIVFRLRKRGSVTLSS
jgi:hypothetical protein